MYGTTVRRGDSRCVGPSRAECFVIAVAQPPAQCRVQGTAVREPVTSAPVPRLLPLCQLRGDSELQQLKLCIQGLIMMQVSVVGAIVGAILGAIVAPLSLGIMRIAVGAAGGGGSRGQVREAQHGGPEHRALIELVDALGAIGAGQAGEGPAVNEAAAVTMPPAEAGPAQGTEGRRRRRRRGPTAAAA